MELRIGPVLGPGRESSEKQTTIRCAPGFSKATACSTVPLRAANTARDPVWRLQFRLSADQD